MAPGPMLLLAGAKLLGDGACAGGCTIGCGGSGSDGGGVAGGGGVEGDGTGTDAGGCGAGGGGWASVTKEHSEGSTSICNVKTAKNPLHYRSTSMDGCFKDALIQKIRCSDQTMGQDSAVQQSITVL